MRLLEGVATIENLDAFVERLDAVAEEHGVTVQAFDARYLVDRAHLERAVALADRAFERDENVARDRGMEILLYAAGRRQINRALEIGAKEGKCPVVVLVDDPAATTASSEDNSDAERQAVAALREALAFEEAETLGDYDADRVREFFEVGEAELGATDGDLPGIVRERVALLDVEK